MSKQPNQQSITMVGGKNVAPQISAPEKPPKATTNQPEEQKPAPHPDPEKSN